MGSLGREVTMTLKVKIKKVDEARNMVYLTVNGEDCAYFLSRPQPLQPSDALMLRGALDDSFMRSMLSVANPGFFSFIRNFFTRSLSNRMYVNVVDPSGRNVLMTEHNADSWFGVRAVRFIRKHGLPMEVEGQNCYVLTPRDLERLRKGDIEDKKEDACLENV